MALNIPVFEKFKDAYEQKCFRLIVNAYQTSLTEKVIRLNWDENDISAELQRHMKVDPQRLKWKISTNVESHIPKNIPKTKGFANKYPRIDFRLTSFISTDEYEYFFEAKNLRNKDSALKRRYIDTGINSFVSGKYSNGSILGYLLEGTPHEVVNGINSLLQKDNRKTEFLSLMANQLFDNYCESNHFEIGVLKHFMFDYTVMEN